MNDQEFRELCSRARDLGFEVEPGLTSGYILRRIDDPSSELLSHLAGSRDEVASLTEDLSQLPAWILSMASVTVHDGGEDLVIADRRLPSSTFTVRAEHFRDRPIHVHAQQPPALVGIWNMARWDGARLALACPETETPHLLGDLIRPSQDAPDEIYFEPRGMKRRNWDLHINVTADETPTFNVKCVECDRLAFEVPDALTRHLDELDVGIREIHDMHWR